MIEIFICKTKANCSGMENKMFLSPHLTEAINTSVGVYLFALKGNYLTVWLNFEELWNGEQF